MKAARVGRAMRTLWVLLIAVLVAPVASAQEEFGFATDQYARVAVGDVPLTSAVEADGFLHTVEYLRFDHDGNQTILDLPGRVDQGCTCSSFSLSADQATVGNNVEAGSYVFWIRNEAPASTAAAVDLAWATNGQVVIFHAADQEVTAAMNGNTLACAQDCVGSFTFFDGDLTGFWATIHPAVTTPAPAPVAEDGFGLFELVLGVVIGIAIWFALVQKGFVQARSRKQVVSKAAHEEVAAVESQEMLGARKRILMAGLKELEMAKMKAEVDDATYDALKTELKKEAVTTMRALESQS